MEAVPLHSSQGQTSSPNKQFRNYKKNNRSLVSRRSEDSVAPNNSYGGLLHTPPRSLSFSYPPLVSRQPPLLPLPIPRPINNNPLNRGLSCPPIDRKVNNRTRDHHSLTPKKSKPSISPKKAESKQKLKSATKMAVSSSKCLTNPLGPDPKDLPKDVSRVLSSSSVNCGDLEKFSDSVVFTDLSPPPSSLPLPTFSLRPKLSCNAEAAGIDAGATDNLRRLLRLR